MAEALYGDGGRQQQRGGVLSVLHGRLMLCALAIHSRGMALLSCILQLLCAIAPHHLLPALSFCHATCLSTDMLHARLLPFAQRRQG